MIHEVTTVMPRMSQIDPAISTSLPNGVRWPINAVRRQAVREHRDLIKTGARVEVTVPDYGVVSFEFTPTAYRTEPGLYEGTFTPFDGVDVPEGDSFFV